MRGHWKDFLIKDEALSDLGGNLHHGDGQTNTPRLWDALIDRFAPRSVLDVGAGEGHAAAYFHRHNVIAHGIEGLQQNVDRARFPVALHDLKSSPYIYPCDLVYCVEVVEHIKESYLDNLMVTLTNAPVVVMTHALPGQQGHHHVNNQPPEYWVDQFEAHGYRPAIDIEHFRSIAAKERADCYFAKTGLIFLEVV